jgi:hypothetical protein
MKIEDILEKLVGGVTKPAQTRIKQVTRGDGTTVYIPQHKSWWIWYDFYDYEGTSNIRHTNPWFLSAGPSWKTIDGAKLEIDRYISNFNHEADNRTKDKLRKQEKEVTYIKYP